MSRTLYKKHETAKVISELMKSKYVNGALEPRACDVPALVLQELHVMATYWKARRVRELPVDMTQGFAEGNYALLPVYVHLLKKLNPGTLCLLKTTDELDGAKILKYMFMSMGASMVDVKYLQQVVFVDGTQLTGKFKGCLLMASMQEGNFQIFLVAFVVVEQKR